MLDLFLPSKQINPNAVAKPTCQQALAGTYCVQGISRTRRLQREDNEQPVHVLIFTLLGQNRLENNHKEICCSHSSETEHCKVSP